MIYILIVLLVIVMMVMFVFIGLYYRACGRNQDDLQDWATKQEEWNKKCRNLETKNSELNKKIDGLNNKVYSLLEEVSNYKTMSAVEAQGEIHTADIQEEIKRLMDEREILQGEMKNLQEEIKDRSLKITGLATTQFEFLQALAKSKETQLQIENVSHGLENRNRKVLEEIGELEKKKSSLVLELNRLLNIQKVIDDDEDGVVWEPILTEKQAKLVQLLRELILMYPDLEIDFATIEWKKIWMPQLQQLGKTIDGKKGIYRLILKDNKMPPFQAMRDGVEVTLPYCYVGQAVNIKERWYQHVKKMIGVMSKGNERVYEWRPEDFKWCIVESGNIDLDASEKYWIQYFAAKEGLNKKL